MPTAELCDRDARLLSRLALGPLSESRLFGFPERAHWLVATGHAAVSYDWWARRAVLRSTPLGLERAAKIWAELFPEIGSE